MDLFKKSVALPSAEKVPLDRLEIPLLPLAAVLFPGGVLSLKLSEQRYLKMAAACMESRAPFGVCLVLGGKEAGQGVQPHKVGTLAYIDRGDLPPSDVLSVNIRGGRRFRILSQVLGDDGLLRAQVELLLEPERREVPVDQRGLLPLLRKVVGDLGGEKIRFSYWLSKSCLNWMILFRVWKYSLPIFRNGSCCYKACASGRCIARLSRLSGELPTWLLQPVAACRCF